MKIVSTIYFHPFFSFLCSFCAVFLRFLPPLVDGFSVIVTQKVRTFWLNVHIYILDAYCFFQTDILFLVYNLFSVIRFHNRAGSSCAFCRLKMATNE